MLTYYNYLKQTKEYFADCLHASYLLFAYVLEELKNLFLSILHEETLKNLTQNQIISYSHNDNKI